MAINYTTPNSPGWWFQRLMCQLAERQTRLNRLDRYGRGDCDLPIGAEHCSEGYRAFQRKARSNFAGLVVSAVSERMHVAGFRTGAAGDENGDAKAWDIWQANSLDADQNLVHDAMLTMADAYVIVGPKDDTTGAPLITPEDPRQVITAADPRNRRQTIAALKVFYDDVLEADVAYLYLPGEVWRLYRERPYTSQYSMEVAEQPVMSLDTAGWELVDTVPQILPKKVVPVVRFANRSDMQGRTLGEFEDVIDMLDRINHTVLQRLVITAMQAYRQRALIGGDEEDGDGNRIAYDEIFTADPGGFWHLPEGSTLWESATADIQQIISAAAADVKDLAAITRTPPYYLLAGGDNRSAESAATDREGLVFKTENRLAQTGESWEQVMSLAFMFAGDTARADRKSGEVLWASPERFTLGEKFDAASKAQAAGVPWRTTMSTVLQYSPQQIAQMEVERAADKAAAPPPPQVVVQPATGPVPANAAPPVPSPAPASPAPPTR